VGGLNTVLSYLIYLIFVYFISYLIAYTIAFALSIVISYSLNTYYVFNAPWRWRKLVQFPIVYLVQYIASILLMSLLIEYMAVDERVAPLVVVVLVLPITYVLSKWVIQEKMPGPVK